MNTEKYLAAATAAFLEAAAFTATVEIDGEQVDDARGYGFHPEDEHRARIEVERFYLANNYLLKDWLAESFGHNLWLNSQGHGCGFWDFPDKYGHELSRRCEYIGHLNVFYDSGDLCLRFE